MALKRFQNILVFTRHDPAESRAVERAVELARESGARLTVVSAVPALSVYARLLLPQSNELVRLAIEARTNELEAVATPLRAEGLEIEVDAVCDLRPGDLVARVIEGAHDLLLKSADEESALRRFFVGSFDLALMRDSPAAVWLLQDQPSHRFRRILVAVDPTLDDPQHSALNQQLLELGSSLATLESAELHVIYVRPGFGEQALASHLAADELRDYVTAAKDAAQRRTAALLEPHGFREGSSRVHLEHGDAGLRIPHFVKKEGVDLLVLGTVARTGVPGLVIGNTAERILRQVECSLLAIKPEGFVSPMQRHARPFQLGPGPEVVL